MITVKLVQMYYIKWDIRVQSFLTAKCIHID